MRLPFDGQYPVSRGFIKSDTNMPPNLQDPVYGSAHRGIDYALPTGTTLKAAIPGTVTYAGWSADGAGNIVVIKSGTLLVKTFHMASVSVALGQTVKEGEVIGTSGNSGRSTGPHLHFQVEEGLGNAVDPAKYLNVTDVKEVRMPNEGDIHNAYLEINNRKATPEEVKAYVNKPFNVADGLFYGKVVNDIRNLRKSEEKLRKERDNATFIADKRAEWIREIGRKLKVDPENIEAILSTVSVKDSDKKLQQIKEIVNKEES